MPFGTVTVYLTSVIAKINGDCPYLFREEAEGELLQLDREVDGVDRDLRGQGQADWGEIQDFRLCPRATHWSATAWACSLGTASIARRICFSAAVFFNSRRCCTRIDSSDGSDSPTFAGSTSNTATI